MEDDNGLNDFRDLFAQSPLGGKGGGLQVLRGMDGTSTIFRGWSLKLFAFPGDPTEKKDTGRVEFWFFDPGLKGIKKLIKKENII